MRKIKKKIRKRHTKMRKVKKKLGNTGENEEISLKMRKIGQYFFGKLGTFLFLKLRSRDFFYFCAFFATLFNCPPPPILYNLHFNKNELFMEIVVFYISITSICL